MRTLSTFMICLLAAATAQARSPLLLQQRRTIEYRKRIGLARSQLRQYKTTGDQALWVRGRENRALAGRVKVKLWRADAVKARKTGDIGRALRIERRANQLTRAIQRYSAETRDYVNRRDAAQKQSDRYKDKPLGSPVKRLWYERSSPAEIDHARGSHAANRIAARRLQMEAFTGAKPLTPHEVRRWLNKLPGSGRNQQSFHDGVGDGFVVKWSIVRTGKSKNGAPQGYVRTEFKHPDTGEVFTQYHGTSISWVRRTHGKSMSKMVLYHRARRRKDGSIAVPAGTLNTVSREQSGDSRRTTALSETLDGVSRQWTTTRPGDGSTERFEMTRGPDGSIHERLARRTSDGRWSVKDKIFDQQGLAVFKQDSSGKHSEHAVTLEAEGRLFRRLGTAAASPRARISRYKDGSWTWRQQVPANNALGIVDAHGRDGKLGAVTSGYVSPLGTRYGKTKEVVRGTIGKPRAKEKPVKTRTYHYLRRENNRWPETAPPAGVVTSKDRERLQRAETLVNTVRRRPIKAIIDDAGGEDNAYAQPANNTVFGRTGGRIQTVTNVDVANMGSQFARGSLPLQVGVMLHEGGHEFQTTRSLDIHRSRAGSLRGLQRPLAAGVAEILAADSNRTLEREADRAAGLGLGRLRKLTGDRSMTPADNVRMLQKTQKGAPFTRTWNPTAGYDSLRDRSRTLWRAFGKGLSKPAPTKQPGQK